MKWAHLAGDTEVSYSFGNTKRLTGSTEPAFGRLGGWGAGEAEEGLSQQHGVQVTSWD